MIRIICLALLIVLTSCNRNEDSESEYENLKLNQEITIEGSQRDYHIYVPDNTVNKPVVILLHGNGGNFDDVIGQTSVQSPQKKWLDLAESNEFILVVPNGSLGSNNKRGWNDCRTDADGSPQTNDVLFINQLLDKIDQEYNYNENKMYVAGISNGGHMAMRLALEIPEKVTAFAAVVASMPENSQCTSSSIPISALFMNGTEDPILPYNGGQMAGNRGLVKSTDESIAFWTNRNNISTSPIELILNNSNSSDDSSVVKYSYLNGSNSTEVELYKIISGGHTEPSISERYGNFYLSLVGNQNGDIEMANEIWDFFKDKSK